LALATLLDLDYEETNIQEKGLTKNASVPVLDNLVKDFWSLFNSQYEGAIPPGMIFLPGQKVASHKGFGWAPRTWMSAHEVDYPDPLSNWKFPTTLEADGLGVKYPGFLLHTRNMTSRRIILGTDQTQTHFTFPVDRKLLEWYNAKRADKETPHPQIDRFVRSNKPLAIILSRAQPGESPYEIGLLVEIHKTINKKTYGENAAEADDFTVYNCYIIQRMLVWRQTESPYLAGPARGGLMSREERGEPGQGKELSPHWELIAGTPKETDFSCIGQVLEPNQSWVVDGNSHLFIPKITKFMNPPPGEKIRIDTLTPPESQVSREGSAATNLPKQGGWFLSKTLLKLVAGGRNPAPDNTRREPEPGRIRSTNTSPFREPDNYGASYVPEPLPLRRQSSMSISLDYGQ